MFEIEAKVRLSKADFNRLQREISKFAKKKEDTDIKDSYYSSPKNTSLRIRVNNGCGTLNIKSKKKEQGIEMNHEIELPLKSPSKFSSFLQKIGFPLTATKEKKGDIYQYGDMRIELNFIKKLGYFLEIENIVKKESDILSAKKALRAIFNKLGFDSSDYEKKSYLELLAE
jgi:predicted adenylyl cyclase CyaB